LPPTCLWRFVGIAPGFRAVANMRALASGASLLPPSAHWPFLTARRRATGCGSSKENGRHHIGARRNGNDTRTGCCRQGGVKPRRQRKMTEEVRRELHLPASCCSLEILQSHNSGIVDQDLQRSRPVSAEPSHRSQIRNVSISDLDGIVTRRNPDVFRNSLCRSRPTHCGRDCRACSAERLRCRETDAGGRTLRWRAFR
jgi:hypothetical protein